jgi:hypothetical protein
MPSPSPPKDFDRYACEVELDLTIAEIQAFDQLGYGGETLACIEEALAESVGIKVLRWRRPVRLDKRYRATL